uniref:(northern house mosquito) hypothetical protein n=1 Tax=Culex pipiens TaxID=7175 RepID=A0A8D8GMC8_CULPI
MINPVQQQPLNALPQQHLIRRNPRQLIPSQCRLPLLRQLLGVLLEHRNQVVITLAPQNLPRLLAHRLKVLEQQRHAAGHQLAVLLQEGRLGRQRGQRERTLALVLLLDQRVHRSEHLLHIVARIFHGWLVGVNPAKQAKSCQLFSSTQEITYRN